MDLPVKTLICCLFAWPAFGQAPRFSLTLQGGPGADWKPVFSDTDWNKLAQENAHTSDTSFVMDRTSTGSCSWGDLSLQVTAAKKWWNRLYPVIGLSVGAGPGGRETIEWERTGVLPYDTVSGSGGQYYLDSAFLEKIEKNYRSVTASVGARFILETGGDNESGISWYFGLGVKYAFPVQSSIETVHEQKTAVYISGPVPALPEESNREKYTIDAPGISRLVVFLPLGLRVSMSDRWQLGAEFSPGYCLTSVKGFNPRSSFFFMAGMGLTYRFPERKPRSVPAYES